MPDAGSGISHWKSSVSKRVSVSRVQVILLDVDRRSMVMFLMILASKLNNMAFNASAVYKI